MSRTPFSLDDLRQDCRIDTGCHSLDGRALGLRIHVPEALFGHYPYNASAYAFLQQLRGAIHEYGIIEFPGLPLNKTNYTLAQRAPKEHAGHPNPYMTATCQQPHQDTPPYPTAFWLGERRQYFATWVMSLQGLDAFLDFTRRHQDLTLEDQHREMVPHSLQSGTGLLLNREPGLLLIDNSEHQCLYHARTCVFAAVASNPGYTADVPMYAYNEMGLLHYMETLDIYRGDHNKDDRDKQAVMAFLATET